jgi:hypothetical protein
MAQYFLASDEIGTASARGADGGRVVHLTAPRFAGEMWELVDGSPVRGWNLLVATPALERQQHVHHLAAVSRLLHVGELAVATIGDAGLRDLA